MALALAEEYSGQLRRYLADPDESALEAAYEFGRRALEDGVGLVDVVAAHGVAMSSLAPEHATTDDARRSVAFLVECLGPFEMAFRGFREANDELRSLNVELERRIADRTEALAHANSELEAFNYSVSHDLRAPLRAVDGFSRMVLEDYADRLDDDGRHALERVRAGARHMGELIDEILKLSRLSRRDLRLTDVDVSAMGEEVVAALREQQPGAEVEVDITPGLTARADAELLRVALTNLLGNAFKFTRREPHPRVELGLEHRDHEPVYFVRDNGAGFDMAYADKLFRPFERLHAETDFPGTGVGLATVRRIVHRLGGRIWAQAAVGEGATFYFTLGTGPPSPGGAAEHPADAWLSGRGPEAPA